MANINIVIAGAGKSGIPIYWGKPVTSETITSSGTSAQSTIQATNNGQIARVCGDGNVYVNVGTNPTAAIGSVWFLPSGQPIDLLLDIGDKIAVIDA